MKGADMHTVQLNGEEHLDFRGSGIEFTSHSCDPNCRFVVGKTEEGGFATLIAIKPIKAHEAATFDYETTEWDMSSPFHCLCRSAGCKGLIRGYRYLSLENRKKIQDLASPFIQSMILERALNQNDRAASVFHLEDWLHGQHMILSQDIKAGDVIGHAKGIICSNADMHTVQVSATEHVDFRGSGVEYASHSCAPTCRLLVGKEKEGNIEAAFVTLVALVDMKAGDAPSFDYESTEWDMSCPFNCLCGASRCKGHIRGFKYLDYEDQKSLQPLASPFIQAAFAAQVADA